MTFETTPTKRPLVRRLLPLWLAIGLVLIIFIVAKSGSKKPEIANEPSNTSNYAYVATSKVNIGDYSPELTLYGTLKAENQVEVISQSSGKISKIHVKNAQIVKSGDKLIEIENEDLQFQLNASKANLDDIKARITAQNIQYKSDVDALEIEQSLLAINQKALDRQAALVKDGLASQSDLESTQRSLQSQKLALNNRKLLVEKHQTTIAQLNATKTQLEANLSQLQKSVNDLVITADFDGTINQLNIRNFENISANQALFTLVNQSQLEIEAFASVKNLRFEDLIIGTNAVGIIDDTQINLSLTSFDQVANQGSIKLSFESNGTENLAVNRYVQIKLPLNQINNVYAVPVQSVYSNNRIYEVIDGQLKRINIKVVGKVADKLLIQVQESNVASSINVLTTRLNDAINGLQVNELSADEQSKILEKELNNDQVKL